MASRRVSIALALVMAVASAVTLRRPLVAQSTPRPEFDAASVKRHIADDGSRGISFSPSGRVTWTAMTLKQLMQSAYVDVSHTDIVGGPRWTETDRFDVVATSPDAFREIERDGTPRGLFMRLHTLLENRFRLKTHVETRMAPVYFLQPAATPMTMGRSLQKTSIDCEAVTRDLAVGRRPDAPDGQPPFCAMRVESGHLLGHAITMDQVAGVLSRSAGRPVINRTALGGTFDVDLRWATQPLSADPNGAAPPPGDGATLFTAVREQLGLRLEAARAELPVLVIDSAQLPEPD